MIAAGMIFVALLTLPVVSKPRFQISDTPVTSHCNISGLSSVFVDPFGGAKPRLLRRGEETRLRVNPEPFGCTQGLQLVERQARVFRPGSRRVDMERSWPYPDIEGTS